MVEHQRSTPERGDRIGDALAGDVEGGAVDRLEHRGIAPLGVEVGGRAEAERAGQGAREIAQDVGVQVGRDDHVQALGLQHHARGHGVDQLLVGRDARKLGRGLGKHLVPQHHAVALRVGLGHQRQVPPGPALRQGEGEAHDPPAAGPREHRGLDADLLGQAAMHAPAGAGVLALRVLAHHDPVELARRDVAQRTRHARQQARRPDVGVLVEALADRQAQAPQRDVVRDVGGADRAEIDRIEAAQLVEPVVRHHPAMGAIVSRAPVEALQLDLEPGLARRERAEHLGRRPRSPPGRCRRPATRRYDGWSMRFLPFRGARPIALAWRGARRPSMARAIAARVDFASAKPHHAQA